MSCASCGQREDRCRCATWCGVCGADTNHSTLAHEQAEREQRLCRACGQYERLDDDPETRLCRECAQAEGEYLSEQASFYTPEGGSNG